MKVACSVLSCRISTATCERLFSAYKQTKTPRRNRLSDERLGQMVKMKQFLRSQSSKRKGRNKKSQVKRIMSTNEHPPLQLTNGDEPIPTNSAFRQEIPQK